MILFLAEDCDSYIKRSVAFLLQSQIPIITPIQTHTLIDSVKSRELERSE